MDLERTLNSTGPELDKKKLIQIQKEIKLMIFSLNLPGETYKKHF